MDLRPELLPPVVPEERVRVLSEKIHRIEEFLYDDRAATTAAIAAFNEETGHDYEPADFLRSYGTLDVEDFALEAARPTWPTANAAHPAVHSLFGEAPAGSAVPLRSGSWTRRCRTGRSRCDELRCGRVLRRR
jgi:hypothetical protein